MKFLLIPIVLILAACNSNPVKTSFPDAPKVLMETPEPLVSIPTKVNTLSDGNAPSGIPLSVYTTIVAHNYMTCNLYKEQIFSLQNWILQQKANNP